MSSSWRPGPDGVGAEASAEEARCIAAFASAFPALAVGFATAGRNARGDGCLSIHVACNGGRYTVTLRDDQADEYGFLDLVDPSLLWDELEAAVSDGRVRWKKNSPKGRTKS